MKNFEYKVISDGGVSKKLMMFFLCRKNLEKVESILKELLCPYIIGGDYFEPIVQVEVDNRSEYLYIRKELECLNLV